MFNSIQQFETAGIKNLRKAEDEFIRTRDMANFINAIKEVVLHLGLDVIAETLENYDEAIRKSPKRSEKWSVVRKDPKQLVTSLGTVQYRKTLFINKTTKERSYLLDRELSLEKHQRITEDAEAQLLTEAVQTTYRKGGEAVSILDDVSKETVMDKIRTIDFTKVHKAPETLREIPYLYIDADEDHVALQFHEHKGDVRTNSVLTQSHYLIFHGLCQRFNVLKCKFSSAFFFFHFRCVLAHFFSVSSNRFSPAKLIFTTIPRSR